jgi:hypothetical protein
MTRITFSEIGSFRCEVSVKLAAFPYEVTGMRTDHINLTSTPGLQRLIAQASMPPSKNAVFSNNIFILLQR